ncbi:MAG: nitrogenase component 1 [Myxococcota bacterium]
MGTFDELTLDDLVIKSSSHTPFFGSYVATHAIADGLCMCHASVGCKVKTQTHLKNHDAVRTSYRRMRYSQFIDEDLINGSTAQLEDEIIAWQKRQESGVVIIDTSTPISLQAQSWTGVVKRTEEATGVPVIPVNARNYEDDLYGGYAATIGAILKKLDWDEAEDREDVVSVIGYPFDRYEGDHQGNVAELRRMLKMLGLRAESVLMSGEPWSQVEQVVHASAHLVLPYAHRQARVLKKRKQKVAKTCLPMSLAGTQRWLEQVAEVAGVSSDRVERVVEHERTRIRSLVEVVHRTLSGRRFAVFAEAPRAAGVVASLMEVGAVPHLIGVLHFRLGGRERVERELEDTYGLALPDDVRWMEDPTPGEIAALDLQGCEFAVGTSIERELIAHKVYGRFLEFGFPSEQRHFLFPSPYLGFAGYVRFLEQALQACETDESPASEGTGPPGKAA